MHSVKTIKIFSLVQLVLYSKILHFIVLNFELWLVWVTIKMKGSQSHCYNSDN